MRPVTPPTVTVGTFAGGDSTTKTHPAFGMVLFSRRSGHRDRLFGSEIDSGQTIALQVCAAEEIWHLSEKRYHAHRSPMIEVEMTPSQFAELITTMNIGSGVPCTIRSFNHETVPDFIDKDTLREQIKADIDKSAKGVVDLVKKMEADLASLLASTGISKVKQESLTKTMASIKMQLASNMPFVLDQYHEAVEKVTAAAKTEVDAYITHAVTVLGVDALKDLMKSKEKPALDQSRPVETERLDVEDRLPYSSDDE